MMSRKYEHHVSFVTSNAELSIHHYQEINKIGMVSTHCCECRCNSYFDTYPANKYICTIVAFHVNSEVSNIKPIVQYILQNYLPPCQILKSHSNKNGSLDRCHVTKTLGLTPGGRFCLTRKYSSVTPLPVAIRKLSQNLVRLRSDETDWVLKQTTAHALRSEVTVCKLDITGSDVTDLEYSIFSPKMGGLALCLNRKTTFVFYLVFIFCFRLQDKRSHIELVAMSLI